MSDVVDAITSVFAAMRLSGDLRPLAVFLVLLAAGYAVFLGPLFVAVRRGRVTKTTAAFWMFVSPWIAGFLIFTAGPMLYSLVLSFNDWDLLNPPKFAGLGNYTEAATDPLLRQALKVTLTYAVISVPLQTAYVVTQQGSGKPGGGPSNSLLFYMLYLYRNAFEFFRMGYASALAWILLVIILLLTALVFRGSSFWVYYESARPEGKRRVRVR